MCVVRRYSQWVPIVAAGTMYGIAFALPAVDLAWEIEGQPASKPMHISGPSAFGWAFDFRSAAWLANPLAWVAAFLLAWRLWPWAALAATGAAVLALREFVSELLTPTGSVFLAGYWLWAGSMVVLALAALAGWVRLVARENRRSVFQVFRGWRGVALGSWLATGLAVLGVAWFWNELEKPASGGGGGSRDSATITQAEPIDVGGVMFSFERKPNGSHSGSWGGNSMHYEIDKHKVEINNGELLLDGVDHGTVKAGDAVKYTADGKLLVNNEPRGPHPIRPKQVEPPTVAFPWGEEAVAAVAWRPDGSLVVMGHGTIRGAKVGDEKPTFAIKGPRNARYLAVSPDGKRIAAAGYHGDGVFVWNEAGGDSLTVAAAGGKEGVRGVAFIGNDHVAVARGKQLSAFKLGKDDAKPVPLGPVRDNAERPLSASADGRVLALLNEDDKLSLIPVKVADGTLTPGNPLILEGLGYDATPTLSRDGTLLFGHRDGYRNQAAPRGLFAFSATTGVQGSSLKWRYTPGMSVQVTAAAFSPDGTLAALGEVESVRVYDVASGRERAWFGHFRRDFNDQRAAEVRWCQAVAFSPDGKYLAAGFGEGKGPRLKVWETAAFLAAAGK